MSTTPHSPPADSPTAAGGERAAGPGRVLVRDLFADDRLRGQVIGTCGPGALGAPRLGADAERVLAIDHGALRIQPLDRPGWGRAGLAYGPFKRTPGLALAVLISNAHNLSQTYELKSWGRLLGRWAKGSGTDPMAVRALRWLGHRPRISLPRKIRHWWLNRRIGEPRQHLRDNLAVGFFPGVAPADPTASGNAFVVHASEDWDNGELRVRSAGGVTRVLKGLQNIPVCYVVVLRERGAVYYAASLPAAHGPGTYPFMRPVAIDALADEPEVYAGLWQAFTGEIGFTTDTRVHGVAVAELPGSTDRFGGAHTTDVLAGLDAGGLGGPWRIHGSELRRETDGAAADGDGVLLKDPGAPTGLLHALLRPPPADGRLGLAWRSQGPDRLWAFTLGASDCALEHRDGARVETIARAPLPARCGGRPASVQVLDDGRELRCFIDGDLALPPVNAPDLAPGSTGVGIVASGRGGLIREFEAHPREMPMPEQLNLGPPWSARGTRVVVRDDFAGPRAELAGRRTPVGGKIWRRDVGIGAFETTGGHSARVVAGVGAPAPGRTIYTVEWDNPGLADLELEMTPPGAKRGEAHNGRSGLIFWQDPRNYILINIWLDDGLGTASISSFFYVNGFEDLYDAVWTCTGEHRITWGVPFRFRAVCDGDHYLVWVNGEPVLHRRLTDVYPHLGPMRLNRVGLQTNWEWGTDTGTVFRDFVVRV